MFDPISLSLVGAGVGALFNKKNPLEGAAMGAALGYGGAALPGLLGGSAATGAAGVAAGESAASGLAPVATGVSTAGVAANALPAAAAGEVGAYNAAMQGGAMGGLLSTGGTALNAANQVKNLTSEQQRPIVPAQIPTPMPNTTLGQMVQGQQQQQIQQQMQQQQARQMRRGLL